MVFKVCDNCREMTKMTKHMVYKCEACHVLPQSNRSCVPYQNSRVWNTVKAYRPARCPSKKIVHILMNTGDLSLCIRSFLDLKDMSSFASTCKAARKAPFMPKAFGEFRKVMKEIEASDRQGGTRGRY